jgi:membrane glycosyltransferase
MRKAGFEVRVLPDEDGSWEKNPPTLIEFIRRDLRWCQGNMQHLRLLGMTGLHPVSRAQLRLAILMFVGSPAWIAFMTLGVLRVGLADDPTQTFDPQMGLPLFTLIMIMVFAPKIATLLDVLASPTKRLAFGGVPRVLAGFVTEVFFSALLAPVMALAHTRFSARSGLRTRRRLVGAAAGRPSRVPYRRPQTVMVADPLRRLRLVWLGLAAPVAMIGFLPFLLGSFLSVPIATITAEPRLGRVLGRLGLWRRPEENSPSADLRALQLPTLHPARLAPTSTDTLAEAASRQ